MNIDELINSAFEHRGGMLDTSNLYAVVGVPVTEELFVLNLEDYFLENLKKFQDNDPPGTILLGAYTSEEEAYNGITQFRTEDTLGSGLIMHPEWVMVM